ncbi:MAG: right-handed parallel beta-helix repeat-containing protein [Rhodobacteraceae bacterium]|nr:right-handed parallel beta-helix repeat-containing protein [Paracoccaceae bacterium]
MRGLRAAPALALALLAALARPAPGWEVPAIPGTDEVAAIRTAIEARPLPATAPGRVLLARVAEDRALRRLYRDGAPGAERWTGTGIVIETGVFDLPGLARALPAPGWLDCAGALCTLRAPLVVRPGATLVVADVTLRLSQEHGAGIISHGRLAVSDATVTGWHLGAHRPAATDAEGRGFRPFLAGLEGGETLIRRARLAHLGYQAHLAYGLSLATVDRESTTLHPRADIVASRIEDAYIGIYSFDAVGVNVIANTISLPHLYGIDPHDDSRDLLIAENRVEGARRSHGIILSRRIRRAAVVRNTSRANAGAGFFIEKASHNAVFAGNLAEANGGDGLVVHESREVVLSGNRLAGNAGDGIRIRASFRIGVYDNAIVGNGRYGLRIYDFAHARRRPTAEEAGQILPVLVRVGANRIEGNGAGACAAPAADAAVVFEAAGVCTLPPPSPP